MGVFEEALKEAQNQPLARTAPEDAGYEDDRDDGLADEAPEDDLDDEFARLARAAEGMAVEEDTGEILERRMSGGARPKRALSAPETQATPRLTLEEAVQRISPEAREVLEKTLKGSFREVRAYRKK